MPKKTTKKVDLPTPKRKKSTPTKPKITQTKSNQPNYQEADDLYYINDKKYIDVNKVDYIQEKKGIYVIAILIPFVLAIGVLWFIGLKNNISKTAKDVSFASVQNQIKDSLDQLKNGYEFDTTSTDTALSDEQLEEVKNDIIEKVKTSLDSSNWPVHESATMGISLQYPLTWSQTDENKIIRVVDILKNSDSTSTAEITISLKTATKNTKLPDWIKNNFTAENYKITTSTNYKIASSTLTQFNNIKIATNEINSILFLQRDSKIYQINIKSLDKNNDGALIEKIIKTIKFL